MKSILLSIKPKYVTKILNGEKTIEVRKRFPEEYKGWVYIYCTKDRKYRCCKAIKYFEEFNKGNDRFGISLNGKVVARFYCDKIEEIRFNKRDDTYYIYRREKMNIGEVSLGISSCLSHRELNEYLQESNGYAIHISQLEVFDKPIELSEFYKASCKGCFAKNTNYCDEKYCRITKAPQSYMFIEVEE